MVPNKLKVSVNGGCYPNHRRNRHRRLRPAIPLHFPWDPKASSQPQQKRVYNGKSDPCGAVHVTIGDGGKREGLQTKYKDPSPEWSEFREASFGHGELKIVNSTHAFWSWHRNDDDEPVRSDEVWLTSLNISSGCAAKERKEAR